MSLFFIRFTDSTNNMRETATIHTRLNNNIVFRSARVKERTMLTTWVRGRMARATYWIDWGIRLRGKKVPLKRNMGVMNKKKG